MGRLDLPDVYRDEDNFRVVTDHGNEGARACQTRETASAGATAPLGKAGQIEPSAPPMIRDNTLRSPSVDSPLMAREAGDLIVHRATEELRSCGDPSDATPVPMERADGAPEERCCEFDLVDDQNVVRAWGGTDRTEAERKAAIFGLKALENWRG